MSSSPNLHKQHTVILIAATEYAAQAYEHIVDDECQCRICESKPSGRIVVKQ
jgi:hypothetical protein